MHPIKGIIFDIDGILEYQGLVFPGAIEVIDQLRGNGISLCFLTNSTLKSRASCADKLQTRGFDIHPDEVITASYATAQYLHGLGPRSLWVMLAREGLDEFKDFHQDETDPEYIVVGDYRQDFDFDHLNHALRLLAKGAKLIGMQNELTDGSMGDLELNVGSWVRLLENASGVKAAYIGKPSLFAFQLAMKSLQLKRQEIIMVGDRISTDILGAKNAGLRSVLVKTGEFNPTDLDSDIKADWEINDIRELPKIVFNTVK